jgi:hypothetical protein
MGVIQRTLQLSNTGNNGGITALKTNIPKYNEYLYGVRQGTYVNLLAETAVGKTGLGRHLYIHTPYEEFLRINDPEKLDVFFIDCSLEIAAEANMAAAISRKAYIDYGKVIPPSAIFGWGENKLTEEQQTIVNSYEEYFDTFQKKCVIVDGEIGPNLFHDILFEAAKRCGRFEREGNNINNCGTWTPNNPNMYIICLLDTVNLAETDERYATVKQAMDRMSRIAVLFRNKCNFFFCFLQQISAEIASTDRSRYGITSPILRDAEDSRRPGKDANIVLGLYEPIRHMKEDQTIFKGYDMTLLQSWLRTLHILKHREGVMNKYIPLKAYGAVSYFEQLPYAKDMTSTDYVNATKY